MQNSAARLIKYTERRDHITPTLIELHWLKVHPRIQFKVLLLTYKAINGLAPQYLSDLLEEQSHSRNLRSCGKKQLKVPKTKQKNYGDRAFAKAGPVLWNQLPTEIALSPSVSVFKRKLKTHLFKQTYSC